MDEKRERHEVILAGSGGQGLVLAGIMLGEAAVLEGRQVVQTQAYGVASRGGLSLAEVIVDRAEIVYQQVVSPDVILALTEEAIERFAPQAGRGVRVFYDTTLARPRTGANLVGLPFTQIAGELGNAASVNILSLGAIIAAVPIVAQQSLEAVIRKRFREQALQMNLAALQKGASLI